MARMARKNIQFVKELTQNGKTYAWFVKLGNRPCDCRQYINYRQGKTTSDPYPLGWLPKTIQKFVATHERKVWSDDVWNEDHFIHYIYE